MKERLLIYKDMYSSLALETTPAKTSSIQGKPPRAGSKPVISSSNPSGTVHQSLQTSVVGPINNSILSGTKSVKNQTNNEVEAAQPITIKDHLEKSLPTTKDSDLAQSNQLKFVGKSLNM